MFESKIKYIKWEKIQENINILQRKDNILMDGIEKLELKTLMYRKR